MVPTLFSRAENEIRWPRGRLWVLCLPQLDPQQWSRAAPPQGLPWDPDSFGSTERVLLPSRQTGRAPSSLPQAPPHPSVCDTRSHLPRGSEKFLRTRISSNGGQWQVMDGRLFYYGKERVVRRQEDHCCSVPTVPPPPLRALQGPLCLGGLRPTTLLEARPLPALTESVPGPRLGASQRPWGWGFSYPQMRKLRHREADTGWGRTRI